MPAASHARERTFTLRSGPVTLASFQTRPRRARRRWHASGRFAYASRVAMKLSDPFREAGFFFKVGEYCFELECHCGSKLTVDKLSRRVVDGVTLYDCPSCAVSLVGIAADDRATFYKPTEIPTDDSDGHYMCGFIFGSAVDMELWPPGAHESFIDIPARPSFFSAHLID